MKLRSHSSKILFLSFVMAAASSLSCSDDRPQSPGWSSNSYSGAGNAGKDPAAQIQVELPEETPLNFRPAEGSQMRLLDSRALTVIYSRIFPPRAYGFEHCRNNSYPEISDCMESMFLPPERPFMGTVDLASPRFNRGPQNVRRAEDLTLNYMRTLRVALSRECEALVQKEMQAQIEGRVEANLLIKGERPDKAGLEEFFRKILGAEGSGIAVDIAAEQYIAAYDEYVGANIKNNDVRRRAYFGLCIAIAMDPQVFLY